MSSTHEGRRINRIPILSISWVKASREVGKFQGMTEYASRRSAVEMYRRIRPIKPGPFRVSKGITSRS